MVRVRWPYPGSSIDIYSLQCMCMICLLRVTSVFWFVSQCTQSELDIDSVRSILSEYRIANADITLRYDANADDLIDVIEGNRQVSLTF